METNTKIMAGIASVPERVASLERAVASLAPQVERIAVSLNGYIDIPDFLCRYPHASVVIRQPNGGDAEKFAAVDDWDGFVVTADDDIAYPPEYVHRLLEGIHEHGHDRMVSFHGGTTKGWTGAHSAATVKKIRCLDGLEHDDVNVNVLGTGTLAFHTAHVPLWRDLFRTANMADVHLACHAHRFGIPMVALGHPGGWLRDIQPTGTPSIYEANRAGDSSSRDTRAERKRELDLVDWEQRPHRPRVRVSIATCERPHLLPDLLDDLEREARYLDLEVSVYEDRSDSDYTVARAQVERNGWTWLRSDRRFGRSGHNQLVNAELEGCRRSRADWFVFLPDDVRLVRYAIPRAIDLWGQLEEPSALTLWRLSDHEGRMNWTGRFPLDRGPAFEVFHIDGLYLCRRDLLESFGFRVPGARPPRATSSGVGRAMSIHAHGLGHRMYRVPRSLAVPVKGEPSVMNAHANDRFRPGMVAA